MRVRGLSAISGEERRFKWFKLLPHQIPSAPDIGTAYCFQNVFLLSCSVFQSDFEVQSVNLYQVQQKLERRSFLSSYSVDLGIMQTTPHFKQENGTCSQLQTHASIANVTEVYNILCFLRSAMGCKSSKCLSSPGASCLITSSGRCHPLLREPWIRPSLNPRGDDKGPN